MPNETVILPLVPLKGIIVFPGTKCYINVNRKFSIDAIENAMTKDGKIFLSMQKNISVDYPKEGDLYSFGVIGLVKQVVRIPSGGIRILVEGLMRAECTEYIQDNPFFIVSCVEKKDIIYKENLKGDALVENLKKLVRDYTGHFSEIRPELIRRIISYENPSTFADIVAINFPIKPEEKQIILEETNVALRIEKITSMLKNENAILDIEQNVADKLRENIEKNQRDYYLREQIKVIKEELGEENSYEDSAYYTKEIGKRDLPDYVKSKLKDEIGKLSKIPTYSQEYSVQESYIKTVLDLPWDCISSENTDIKRAREILEKDHYGLEQVKEKIIELLAVKKLTGKIGGSILCLVGPPGTGKTSIAHSLAEAMGRKYVRVSLGGVQNESEIRGHRKTYVGSMPGRIISALKQAGTKNPLILLDEIDKMSSDLRGDPAAAMLEVLDAEQNKAFRDHYIEVPFDLSEVLFIATANSVENIPRPLFDRMEVVEVSGYSDDEKMIISKNFILPKQKDAAGLFEKSLKISDNVIREVIEGYTRESGVRNLERCLRTICRKTAMEITENGAKSINVTLSKLRGYLGERIYLSDTVYDEKIAGIATGLAWTEVGGDTLFIEVNVMEGSGKIDLTGNLGDVMKESAKTAISYIRANATHYNIDSEFFKNKDIHIHIPEGAIPKDGPSAGITMATAIISALTGIPVKKSVAMTGEITLRGRVLPIGGLREKTLAAYRLGIKMVIIPYDNKKDYKELPDKIKKEIKFIFVKDINEVFKAAIGGM